MSVRRPTPDAIAVVVRVSGGCSYRRCAVVGLLGGGRLGVFSEDQLWEHKLGLELSVPGNRELSALLRVLSRHGEPSFEHFARLLQVTAEVEEFAEAVECFAVLGVEFSGILLLHYDDYCYYYYYL